MDDRQKKLYKRDMLFVTLFSTLLSIAIAVRRSNPPGIYINALALLFIVLRLSAYYIRETEQEPRG